MTLNSQVVFWLDDRTKIAFADLRPEVDEASNWRIALFALAKNRLHGELGSVRVRCFAYHSQLIGEQ